MVGASAEQQLLALAMALGASQVPGWSEAEWRLVDDLPVAPRTTIEALRQAIRGGRDPLGGQFCLVRSAERRRPCGATYTPAPIVEAMTAWAKAQGEPARVVDPGAGSGRFTVSAGRAFSGATLVAVELDPVAAILCRGHIAAAGLSERARVLAMDYRQLALPALAPGQSTLFLGNPPYVRHHLIDPTWKSWLTAEARRRGLHPSSLAGLHVYFFFATANLARDGDFGCIITSAEWLDVNYGHMVRGLLLNGLGAQRLVVIEPTAAPFPDAQTTAAISCLEVGSQPTSIFVNRVGNCNKLGNLQGGRRVRRERFETERRWSHLTRRGRKPPEGFVELGEVCRVHRGAVTGANGIWIAGEHSAGLPDAVLFPAVTRARELYGAGGNLTDDSGLRRVIDLPSDLDQLEGDERAAVERFLRVAEQHKAHESYIARHRKPWWCVGLRRPAPILASYMARRPPAFVLNTTGARHLNIAHGLYPREAMDDLLLARLAAYLSHNISIADGRTYAGGLTKFEPREMERLLVPDPGVLKAGAFV